MALRVTIFFLLMATALVASSAGTPLADWGLIPLSNDFGSRTTCDGLVGDCVNQEEEMSMESEITHRILAGNVRTISYQALLKNRVPCKHRGSSYYGCPGMRGTKANSYRRSCTRITRCKRDTR